MKDIIYNEKCSVTLKRMIADGEKVDLIMTSPPYNNSRTSKTENSLKEHMSRYDVHFDNLSTDRYCKGISELFCMFDKVLEKNGVVLWNVSYGNDSQTDSASVMWLSVADIIMNTPFTVADRIVWKKGSALPNNTSPNKLTRICEDVFVFVRKDEIMTFKACKEVSKVSERGQKYYKNYFNFIEARNNDGSCPYNKATYSSDLCLRLFDIYAEEGMTCYDPFMGSGTTAVACIKYGMHYIGSEISENQCMFAEERINKEKENGRSN